MLLGFVCVRHAKSSGSGLVRPLQGPGYWRPQVWVGPSVRSIEMIWPNDETAFYFFFLSPPFPGGGSHDRRRRWDAESPTPPNTPRHPSPCGPTRGLSITPPAARRIERSAGENQTLAPAYGQIEQRRAHIGAQAAAWSHRGEGHCPLGAARRQIEEGSTGLPSGRRRCAAWARPGGQPQPLLTSCAAATAHGAWHMAALVQPHRR
jgi:hypothetical protein